MNESARLVQGVCQIFAGISGARPEYAHAMQVLPFGHRGGDRDTKARFRNRVGIYTCVCQSSCCSRSNRRDTPGPEPGQRRPRQRCKEGSHRICTREHHPIIAGNGSSGFTQRLFVCWRRDPHKRERQREGTPGCETG
jgi:hypothetical protein